MIVFGALGVIWRLWLGDLRSKWGYCLVSTSECFADINRKYFLRRSSALSVFLEQGEFKVTERMVTMPEFIKAANEDRIIEVFGAGTACMIAPIDCILYEGQVSYNHRLSVTLFISLEMSVSYEITCFETRTLVWQSHIIGLEIYTFYCCYSMWRYKLQPVPCK